MRNILLSAQHVCKSFSGHMAVDHVSVDVLQGQITGLIGANGAGKTTFFNCLSGHHHASGGTVVFKGREIQKMSAHKICRLGLARTYQIAKPFGDLSVLENAVVGGYCRAKNKREAYETASESINFVGLGGKREVLASTLNTGDLRRLELARAMATKPELLLLDEVMAGLTPAESKEMTELIQKINCSGITILMIEHIMPVVMSLSHTVYVLERGKLISHGTPEQVSSDPKVIESYLGSEMYA